MSFDRLAPDFGLAQMLTVERKASGYRAVAIPPTFVVGAYRCDDLALIADKEEAIQRNPLIPQVRKAFLCERLSTWDDWARGERNVFIRGDAFGEDE